MEETKAVLGKRAFGETTPGQRGQRERFFLSLASSRKISDG